MPDSTTLKNVLFAAYWFPPGGEHGVQRAAKFCKYLPDFGYRPLVLTGQEKDIRHKLDPSLLADVRDTKVFRCAGFERFLVQLPLKMGLEVLLWLVLRPDQNVLSWLPAARRMASKIAEEYPISAIYATMLPMSDALLGLKLKKLLGVPLIVDYRDPWTTCARSVWPTRLHYWWESRQERRVLSEADAVVVVTPTMKERLVRKFPECEGKTHVIYNGFDLQDLPPEREAPGKGPLRIGFAGVLTGHDSRQRGARLGILSKFFCYRNELTDYSTGSPYYLLHALRALLDESPDLAGQISLTFAGKFGQSNWQVVEELDLQGVVSFKGYIPHNESIRLLSDSDVLFMPMQSPPDGQRSYNLSGKIFEYLGTKRPILATVPEGDLRDVLDRARAGWCVDPRDVDGIKSLLGKLVKKKMAGTLSTTQDQQYVMQFERRELTRQLAELLDSLTSNGKKKVMP
ncbi:MAG TPA: glycosyltransferase [Thermoguttaceae bacterium]|nr:glycosyltransferase [Thermoguttaceae bacterium]